jgi:hypothetical protein
VLPSARFDTLEEVLVARAPGPKPAWAEAVR